MLLSVVIPAYNCKDTLTAAVNSVAVSFRDTEIIIIDDGSTDSTNDVISSLCEKYPVIISKRIENSGPANARNEGIKIASGEYVMFLDSDDCFTCNTFEIIKNALQNKPDMLLFGFKQCFMGRAEDKIYSLDSHFTVDEYYKNNLLNQVWNKAYKTEFIKKNSIFFSDYKYGEDRLFNAEVLKKKPQVSTISDVLYNYNIDKSVSLISGYIPEKFEACKKINNEFSLLCNDKNTLNFMFLKNVLSCMTVLFAKNCKLKSKEKKALIKEIVCDEDVIELVKSKQTGKANEIIRNIIKTQNVFLNFIFAFAVAFCQKYMLPLFLKFRK